MDMNKMNNYTFNSEIGISQDRLGCYPTDIVKNEPMLFSCNYFTSRKLGGPITQNFLNLLYFNLPELEDKDIIVDSRVHMLMPGWYPCIPRWHLDDVPRELEDGQPNHRNPSYKAQHCMAMVNADICPTQFIIGKIELPEIETGEKYYKKWHPIVDKAKDCVWVNSPDRNLIFFNWQTFHQGSKAVGNGWRFFIRASWDTGRKPTNELRRQVQVYLENPMEGW
jgi:hypothetical protein